MSPHAGSCLCGGVRFEIDGDFEGFFLCHCKRCRKNSGSAHGANLFSTNAKLRWLAGTEQVKTFAVEGTRHSRSFCATCGSALPVLQREGAWVVVPAGSLDTDVGLRPNAHIFVAERADWDEALETVPKIDGSPGV